MWGKDWKWFFSLDRSLVFYMTIFHIYLEEYLWPESILGWWCITYWIKLFAWNLMINRNWQRAKFNNISFNYNFIYRFLVLMIFFLFSFVKSLRIVRWKKYFGKKVKSNWWKMSTLRRIFFSRTVKRPWITKNRNYLWIFWKSMLFDLTKWIFKTKIWTFVASINSNWKLTSY